MVILLIIVGVYLIGLGANYILQIYWSVIDDTKLDISMVWLWPLFDALLVVCFVYLSIVDMHNRIHKRLINYFKGS